jgi:hypothetical protein
MPGTDSEPNMWGKSDLGVMLLTPDILMTYDLFRYMPLTGVDLTMTGVCW